MLSFLVHLLFFYSNKLIKYLDSQNHLKNLGYQNVTSKHDQVAKLTLLPFFFFFGRFVTSFPDLFFWGPANTTQMCFFNGKCVSRAKKRRRKKKVPSWRQCSCCWKEYTIRHTRRRWMVLIQKQRSQKVQCSNIALGSYVLPASYGDVWTYNISCWV